MPTCVIICGKMRSGKDTIGLIIKEKKPDFNHLALADEVKRTTERTHGLPEGTFDDEQMKIKYRPNIIMVGKVGRDLDPEMWIKKLTHDVLFHNNSYITDVRFKNEFFYFKSLTKSHNIITVRVKANDSVRISRGADSNFFNDVSEIDLDDVPDDVFDVVIENNDTYKDLKDKVNDLIFSKMN